MTDDLDTFVENLQQRIMAETREALGDAGFERWLNPLYCGPIENPDGYGRINGSCGDTMQIFLKFENNRVKAASYVTDGCGSSAVCGSFAAELALGKTPDELSLVGGQTILNLLGKLPEEEHHCAFLSAETLQEALCDYMQKYAAKTPADE